MDVIGVEVVRPYILEVFFADETKRVVDLESVLWGPMFEPLRPSVIPT